MIKSSNKLVEEAFKIYEENSLQNGISGISTGFVQIDHLTNGWQFGDLIIIGGRPGMGKSAFAISMIKNIAINYGNAVAYFSLDISEHILITRMITQETGISSGKLRKGNLQSNEWEMLNMKLDALCSAPIYIDDNHSLSLTELKTKVAILVAHQNIKLIVIDFLQSITIKDELKLIKSKEEEITFISRNLKNIAKEFNIAIIVLSALPCDIDLREDSKRPKLTDLNKPVGIDHADFISFIYRPEYYGITEWDDSEGDFCEGQAELIVAKNKNGPLGNIRLKFEGHLSKFSDLNFM